MPMDPRLDLNTLSTAKGNLGPIKHCQKSIHISQLFFGVKLYQSHILQLFSGVKLYQSHISQLFSGVKLYQSHISQLFSGVKLYENHISQFFSGVNYTRITSHNSSLV